MRLRRATVWVMIGALALGFTGIGWNVLYLKDEQQNSLRIEEKATPENCDQLRAFIVAEEDVSLELWKKYHRQVIAFAKGLPKSERPAEVERIAANVRVVLESDLRIYRQMKRLPQCLESKFRSDIQEWITSTKEMIDYLNGEGEIEGNRFDPSEGFWDTSFYDAFYSATDNLIEGFQQI
jgi:hypothetical protein